jgi:putative endopeptidase
MINEFYETINKDYLEKSIPNDQNSISNFMDINNENTKKLINLVENIDELRTTDNYNRLIKILYKKKLNFVNENKTIHNIGILKAILNDVMKQKTLINKICKLNEYGLTLFINHGVMENPIKELNQPYILSLFSGGLSFSKEYYFNEKYKSDLNNLFEYRKQVITYLNGLIVDIDINILDDIRHIETLIAPYILSNVKKRDVKERVNKYTINELQNKMQNIDLLAGNFLKEYNLQKEGLNVLFCNNILKMREFDTLELYYLNISEELKNDLDNGDYYWMFINTLFKKYSENDELYVRLIDNYIKWKIISACSGLINEDLRLIKFDFYGKKLSGQNEEKPIKERTISYLITELPELIGKLFCQVYFPQTHLNLMRELITYLLDAYEDAFTNKCNWIIDKDNKSLEEAIKKITKLREIQHQKIGFPDESTYEYKYQKLIQILNKYDYENLSLLEIDLLKTKWSIIIDAEKLQRNVKDNTEWEMCPVMVNAYYHPLKNEIVFPAGILQNPFFFYMDYKDNIDILNNDVLQDYIRLSNEENNLFKSLKTISMASNFGSIGVIIGHEISHGFDDQGSKFDSNGNMRIWWSEEVKNKYNEITKKLVNQFNEYYLEIDGEQYKVNGELTLGENIADLFGLTISIMAFKKYFNDHKINNKLNNKTYNECLFELISALAVTWRYKETKQRTKQKIAIDVHSPAKFRVLGSLKNIPEFYELFNLEMPENLIKIFE